MLSASEFTVGALKDASPFSLILPRTEHEETVLIGHVENAPAAVFLYDPPSWAPTVYSSQSN